MTDRSAALDVGAFAEQILGVPLYPHQLELARSGARYRVACSGRQAGKSRALAVMALHEAATKRNALVLLVSAGEFASRRLLEDCHALAESSPLLRGSVLDGSKSSLTLSQGGRIVSVPASERQIRGNSIDLLIIDEAGFIDPGIWRAAEPSIIARAGSRVVLASSPWGGADHFFRQLWQRGMDAPDAEVAAFHWPSSISPLVSEALLEQIRSREPDEYFRREYLAEWTDVAGSYFSEDELMACVADYGLCPPEELEAWVDRPYGAVAGVDWGFSNDANTLCLVSVLEDFGLNRGRFGDELVLFVPWLEEHYRLPYPEFIGRIAEVGRRYAIRTLASEVNGVGQMPTDWLRRQMAEAGLLTAVQPVVTDVRRKMSGFGMIKGLLQARRLVLPRHPELLKQLRGLQFEQLPTGSLRIAVPDNLGHDDLAMALMQAVSGIRLEGAVRYTPAGMEVPSWGEPLRLDAPSGMDVVVTPGGVSVPCSPRPVKFHDLAFGWPKGAERGDGW